MSSIALKVVGCLLLIMAIAEGGWYARGVVAERDAAAVQLDLDAAKQKVADFEQAERDKQAAVTQQSSDRITTDAPKQTVITQTVTKEVIKYVQNPAHGKCSMPDDWVRAYNSSLGLPDPTAIPTAGPASTGPSDPVFGGNVGTGHAVAAGGNTKQ